jgi:hypothetical protein
MVEAGGVGIFSGIENAQLNLPIFQGAQNAQNDKIGANWNVSGTWTFQRARQFQVANHPEVGLENPTESVRFQSCR